MKQPAKWLALVLALVAVFVIPVSAGGDQANLPETPVQAVESPVQTETPLDKESTAAEAVACVYCDSGSMVLTETVSTDWRCADYIPCQCEGGHSPMQDKVMERTVVNVMTCDSCELGLANTTAESKIVHYR